MLWTIVIIAAIVGLWYWYEGRWDRQLFKVEPGRVCMNVHPREARDFIQAHPDTQVLDVRSKGEFEGGALPDAIHISIGDSEFQQKVGRLDKTKPVLVYCAGGFRSRKAVPVLKALGFADIRHLHRGYHSWHLTGQ